VAIEQSYTEVPFEAEDLLTQRGLAEVRLLSCPAEVQMPCDAHERVDVS
jgi:hypothetical protein